MNWQHGPFESTADLAKDGSGYHVLAIQRGRCFIAWWSWPKDRHFTSNRQRHCLDQLYDGSSKDGAIGACETHRKQRRSDSNDSRVAEYFDDYVQATEDFQHAD